AVSESNWAVPLIRSGPRGTYLRSSSRRFPRRPTVRRSGKRLRQTLTNTSDPTVPAGRVFALSVCAIGVPGARAAAGRKRPTPRPRREERPAHPLLGRCVRDALLVRAAGRTRRSG